MSIAFVITYTDFWGMGGGGVPWGAAAICSGFVSGPAFSFWSSDLVPLFVKRPSALLYQKSLSIQLLRFSVLIRLTLSACQFVRHCGTQNLHFPCARHSIKHPRHTSNTDDVQPITLTVDIFPDVLSRNSVSKISGVNFF